MSIEIIHNMDQKIPEKPDRALGTASRVVQLLLWNLTALLLPLTTFEKDRQTDLSKSPALLICLHKSLFGRLSARFCPEMEQQGVV